MPHVIYVDRNSLGVFSVSGPQSMFPNGHHYEVRFPGGAQMKYPPTPVKIDFQEGPVRTSGVNGVTNEALLAILIDRTEVLDSQFPCLENKVALEHMREALRAFEARIALEHMREALQAFEARTSRRVATGIEGQMTES